MDGVLALLIVAVVSALGRAQNEPGTCMTQLLRQVFPNATSSDVLQYEFRMKQLETPIDESTLPHANHVILSLIVDGPENAKRLLNCTDGSTTACTYEAPCAHQGRCTFVNATLIAPATHQCVCKPGFAGSRCKRALSACILRRPCLNGGSCHAVGKVGFTCLCRPMFDGRRCENRWTSAEIQNITSAVARVVSRLDAVELGAAKAAQNNTSQITSVLHRIEQHVNQELSQLKKQMSENFANLETRLEGTNAKFRSKNVIATSCMDIMERMNASLPSGYYDIITAKSGVLKITKVFCEMTKYGGGWTRVANIDPGKHGSCPGTLLFQNPGVKLCTRRFAPTGCGSATFQPIIGEYSEVMGYVTGYKDQTTDAFSYYSPLRTTSVDGSYVDGVSVTQGSPRKHVWTYASAAVTTGCPCSASPRSQAPAFIGQDFYCNDFEGTGWERWIFSTANHLWSNTAECAIGSACCNDSKQPWFTKRLVGASSDAVEIRVCSDQPDEDENIGIDRSEIFVR